MRALTVNLLVMAASLIAFFGLAEGAARLAGFAPYTPQADVFRQEFEQDDRAQQELFIPNEARIWDLRPGYTGHRTDWGERNWVTLTVNLQGRRDAEVPLAKPAGTYRIALIGDSVAFGARVLAGDAFAARLETSLNARASGRHYEHYEVLNFGVPGYTTWQEHSVLQEKALAYDPDLALLAFVMNDFVDNQHAAQAGYLNLTRVQGLARWLREHSAFYRFLREQVLSVEAQAAAQDPCAGVDPTYCWGATEPLLDQVVDTARQRGVPLVLVVFPTRTEIEQPSLNIEARYQRVLAEYARTHGVRTIDLLPAFRENSDDALFVDEAHPNERGHAIVAREILEQLDAQGLLPPP